MDEPIVFLVLVFVICGLIGCAVVKIGCAVVKSVGSIIPLLPAGRVISGNTEKVYKELLKAVLPPEMFKGDKLMTVDGQEWEAPRDAKFNWRCITWWLCSFGGVKGCYFQEWTTEEIDAHISPKDISSDGNLKVSRYLREAGPNNKRWLLVFDQFRDDIIAHEGFHDVQCYLIRNYPDISSKLDEAVKNREEPISDFLKNTKGLGYSATDVFAFPDFDIVDDALSDNQSKKLGETGKRKLAFRFARNEVIPMLLQSYKATKDKQAEALLSEIFAEAGLKADFFKKF